MHNAIEMIFACLTCNRERQYGLAVSLYGDRPVVCTPVLQCVVCKMPTRHYFIKNELRSDIRERQVFGQMRNATQQVNWKEENA